MGAVNYSISRDNDTSGEKNKRSSLLFAPSFGKQISERWTVGLTALYRRSSYHTIYTDKKGGTTSYPPTLNGSYGGGVFGRYTVPISKSLFLALQTDALYTYDYDSGPLYSGENTNTISLGFTPMLGLNIKNGFALNFIFGNVSCAYSKNDYYSNLGFSTSTGRTFGFGITKNILGKRHAQKKAD